MSTRLAFMAIIGLLAIMIGLTGKLGSLLGAIVDPANMSDTGSSTGGGSMASGGSSTSSVTTMIRQVFGKYADDAIKVATCESSLSPTAVNSTAINGSHATGVFQILYPSTWHTTTYASGNPKDAITNIKAAYEIFARDGFSWREWSCQP